MTRLPRNIAAALAIGAFAFTQMTAAQAAIETDPTALYATMKKAYEQGAAHYWPFADEEYYFSTIVDAGRAYSLFRPNDPAYAEVAELAVDIATVIHYTPLTNNDAAVWYLREASTYVATHGDPMRVAKAQALLATMTTGEDDAPALAAAAEQAALANAHAFPRDGDALASVLVADVRAYTVSHDPTYRSLFLKHGADPTYPIARVPDPEGAQLIRTAQLLVDDGNASAADRANARAILERRKRAVDMQVIASVQGVSHADRLTRTAPADEYFGNLKMSPIGIHNEVVRIHQYLAAGWGARMSGDGLQLESAVNEWQHAYPHDITLPANLAAVYGVLKEIPSEQTTAAAQRIKNILSVEYPTSAATRALTTGS